MEDIDIKFLTNLGWLKYSSYSGARHYDPVLGKWTTVDPLADEYEDMSPYSYVMSNPINLIDPDGMQPNNGDILGQALIGDFGPNPFGIPGYGSAGGGMPSIGNAGGSSILGTGIGAGINFVSQFSKASSAFSLGATTTNWSSFSTVQKNPLNVNTTWPETFLNIRINVNSEIKHNINRTGINEGEIAMSYITHQDMRPYVLGGPKGTIDCSRFTNEVANKAGYNMITNAVQQAKYYQRHGFWSTSLSAAKTGDHIFWYRGGGQYHTGIVYIVNGNIWAIQANVNNHLRPSIHKFPVHADGTQTGFTLPHSKILMPFVGIGRP